MQIIKKFIAAVVAAAMLICVIPIQIFADSSNGFEELNDELENTANEYIEKRFLSK